MSINTKYIFQGDTKKEALSKINYNFDQIAYFGVGPDGHTGNKGATGMYGPAGFKGVRGSTGNRATNWYSQSSEPIGSQEYDLWIDSNTADGVVNQQGSTGTWNDTGYRLFNSLYFKSYEFIQGPAGVTDKYVIGLNNVGASAEYTNLVINDSDLDPIYINPNNSKVLISTEDQIDRPIMSFSKSGAISSGVPSFYWKNLGSLGDLEYRSDGLLKIISYLKTTLNTGASRLSLLGNGIISNSLRYSLSGTGDFYLSTNSTVGSGTFFNISSQNLVFNQLVFNHSGTIKISAATGSYLLNNTPSTAFSNSNIELTVTSTGNSIFEISGIGGGNILSAKPQGTVSSGNFSQTVFGSTGGVTGGTGGPYSYHVRRSNQITQSTTAEASAKPYGSRTSVINTTINNVFDLRNTSFWESDVLVITPSSYTAAGGVYLYLPSTYIQNLYPVYSYGRSRKIRVLLDNTEANPVGRGITGIMIDFSQFTLNVGSTVKSYVSFSSCFYVDLMWISYANNNNPNTRMFWKTCTGQGGYVDLTNLYSVGTEPETPSGTSSGGGTTSGGGCPTPNMLIMTSPNSYVLAGELEKGTEIYTVHENTGDWGYYRVSHAEKIIQPVVSVVIGGKTLTVSDTHKFLLSDGEYVKVTDIGVGNEIKTMDGTSILESIETIGYGEVIKIEVDDAHTYVIDRVISHNKIAFEQESGR